MELLNNGEPNLEYNRRYHPTFNSRICRAISRFFRRTVESFSFYLGRFRAKFSLVSSVVILVVTILCILIVLLLTRSRASRIEKSFVSLEDYSLTLNSFASTSDVSREQCVMNCKRNTNCMAAVHDPTQGPTQCAWFTHTPFYYDLTPFKRAGAAIFVRRKALLFGKLMKDGYYYWATHIALPAHIAATECELYSDFYHLAIQNSNTLSILSQLVPQLGKTTEPESQVIMWRVHEAGQGMSSLKKMYIRVGDSVEYVGPKARGLALCQGDPFNTAGYASLRRFMIFEPEFES